MSALQLHGSNARTFGDFDFFRLGGLLVLTFPASHGTLGPILPLDYPNLRSHPSPRTQGRSCSTLEHAGRLCGGSGGDGTRGRCRGEALGALGACEGAKYGKYGGREGSQAAVPIPHAPVAMVWRVRELILDFRIGPDT